jgi:PST family polysaccharide transporter
VTADPTPSAPTGRGSTLGQRAAAGGATAFLAQGARFAVTLSSAAILARLLPPRDFGLANMVTAITGLLLVFNDIGFSLATIQKPELSEEEANAAFWLQLSLSAVVGCAAAALAPLIGAYYGEPRVTWIALASAPAFLLIGGYAQQQALLRRALRFQVASAIEVASAVVGLGVAVILAFAGAHYWALVAQPMAQYGFALPAYWIASGWRPGRPALRAAAAHFAFGKNFAAYKVVEYVAKSADRMLLGRLHGAVEVGLYSRATSLLTQPFTQLSFPLSMVLLPALSRAQQDPGAWRALYLGAARALGWLTLPVAVLVYVDADDVVRLLLGPDWSESVAIFRSASPGALVIPLAVLINWLFLSRGRTDRMLRYGLVSGAVTLVATGVGAVQGAEQVALYRSIAALAVFAGGLAYATRATPVTVGDVLRALAPPLAGATAGGFLAALLMAWAPPVDPDRLPDAVLRLGAVSVVMGLPALLGLLLTGDGRRLRLLLRPGQPAS